MIQITDELDITNKDHIVVYDVNGLLTSPRAWLVFKVMIAIIVCFLMFCASCLF
jgi:3-mercaptopyruvate sulfurtransferase SseA